MAPTPKELHDWLLRSLRLGKYAFFQIGGVALSTGVDRLGIAPLWNARLGEALFGTFIWWRDLCTLVAMVSTNGFRLQLLRDYVKLPPEEGAQQVRTAFVLTALTAGGTLAALWLGVALFGREFIRDHWRELLVPLWFYGLAKGLEFLSTLVQIVRLQYRAVFCIRVIEGTLLGLSVFWLTDNLGVLATIYAVAAIGPLAVSCWFVRSYFRGGPFVKSETAMHLIRGTWAGATAALIEQLLLYGPRLFLGVLGDSPQEITKLFAATSIANLILLPVTLLGGVIQNYLGAKKSHSLHGRVGSQLMQLTLLSGFGVSILTYAVGYVLIPKLYPNISEIVLGFYGWIAIANGMATVRSILRPIAVKFAPLRRVVSMSSATLVIQIVCLAALIPWYQAAGAAAGMAMAALSGMVVWLYVFHLLRQEGQQLPPTELDETIRDQGADT